MRVELDIKETFNEQENESEIKIRYTWKKQKADEEEIKCTIDHYPLSNDIQEIEVTGDSNPRWERIEGERGIYLIKLTGNKSGNPSPIESAYIELSYKHNLRTASIKDGKRDRKAFLVTDCGGSKEFYTEVNYSLSYPPLPRPTRWRYRHKITFFEKTPRISVKLNNMFGNHEFGFKTSLGPREAVGPVIGVVETVPRLPIVNYISTGIITGGGGYFWDNILQWLRLLFPGK